MVSLEGSIVILIVGIVLVVIARSIHIEGIINKVMYVIGILLVIIGLIFLILAIVGITL